jgi:hypothetical protein
MSKTKSVGSAPTDAAVAPTAANGAQESAPLACADRRRPYHLAEFIRVWERAGEEERKFVSDLIEQWDKGGAIWDEAFRLSAHHLGFNWLVRPFNSDRKAEDIDAACRCLDLGPRWLVDFLDRVHKFWNVEKVAFGPDTLLSYVEDTVTEFYRAVECAEEALEANPLALKGAIRKAIEKHPELLAEESGK